MSPHTANLQDHQLSVMTTRNDKMENHHPSHSKSAAPSMSAWSNKPLSQKWLFAPSTAVKDLSHPLVLGIPLTNSGKQAWTKERKNSSLTHAAIQQFGSCVSLPYFQSPIPWRCIGTMHPPAPSMWTVKLLGSSHCATFSKPIVIWLQVAIQQAVMTQDYH